ncbi:MAG: hypothetical protein ACK4PR_14155, partial [Gammaproteobacteria bacterium]
PDLWAGTDTKSGGDLLLIATDKQLNNKLEKNKDDKSGKNNNSNAEKSNGSMSEKGKGNNSTQLSLFDKTKSDFIPLKATFFLHAIEQFAVARSFKNECSVTDGYSFGCEIVIKNIKIADVNFKLMIQGFNWDINVAKSRCLSLIPLIIKDASLALICAPLTAGYSEKQNNYAFLECVEYFTTLLTKDYPNIIQVIIGSELEKRTTNPKHCMDENEAIAIAREHGAAGYFECSAATGEGVQEAFLGAIELALEKNGFWKSQSLPFTPTPNYYANKLLPSYRRKQPEANLNTISTTTVSVSPAQVGFFAISGENNSAELSENKSATLPCDAAKNP